MGKGSITLGVSNPLFVILPNCLGAGSVLVMRKFEELDALSWESRRTESKGTIRSDQ